MTSSLTKQLLKLAPLALIVAGLLSYNFMSAQWQNPTATAPNNNTEAPINISVNYQAKLGDLGAVRMRAGQYCDAAGNNCFTNPSIPVSGEIRGAYVMSKSAKTSATCSQPNPLTGSCNCQAGYSPFGSSLATGGENVSTVMRAVTVCMKN